MSTGRPRTAQQLQAICDRFNEKVKRGDEVFVKLDGVEEPFKTRTRTEAQILSGHSAVIWLENVSGAYLLDRVTPVNDEAATQRALIDAVNLLARHCRQLPNSWTIQIEIDNSEVSILLIDPNGLTIDPETNDRNTSVVDHLCTMAIATENAQ